jgi:hypothetical protein
MRSIQRNFECPTCKRTLDRIIVLKEKENKNFEDFEIWGDSLGPDYIYDQKSQMLFPKDFYKKKVESLWLCKCNICNQTRRDLKQLRGHVSGEHNMQICSLCVENRHVFPSELTIYTQQLYEIHLKTGDGNGLIGHPNCEFCRKRFYDSSALFQHLTHDHECCHICDKLGLKYKYFNKYQNLEEHFKKSHYLCEEKGCLEKRFIVFSNEIDLASHNLQYHPSLQVLIFFKLL